MVKIKKVKKIAPKMGKVTVLTPQENKSGLESSIKKQELSEFTEFVQRTGARVGPSLKQSRVPQQTQRVANAPQSAESPQSGRLRGASYNPSINAAETRESRSYDPSIRTEAQPVVTHNPAVAQANLLPQQTLQRQDLSGSQERLPDQYYADQKKQQEKRKW